MTGYRVRKAAVFLGTLLVLMANNVLAVGLGNITLDSALNQPLRARIEILDLDNVRPDEIIVSLASPEDFQRFNVDRSGFLINMRFEVEATAAGVFVNLSTSQPVREPFLSFILDTRWSSGRILSEHTVLLDLPVFDDGSPAAPVSQPISPVLEVPQGVVQRQTPATQSPSRGVTTPASPAPVSPEPEEPEITEPQETQPESSAIDAGAVPIPDTLETEASDTLWEIALRVRPDSSVSVQQTMMAIQRLNPDAFVGGNINMLRAGEVLRIPDLSDIESVDQQQAVSEVVRQNQQANIGAEPLTAPATGPSTVASGQQGQLSVVSAEELDSSTDTANTLSEENADLDSRIEALENQLAVREEEADRSRIQQEELLTRLDDLEEQISSAMEIIALQDLQLTQLQESLAEAADEASQQAVIAEPVAEEPQQPSSLLDDLRAIAGNSSILLTAAIILVVLLLVILLLRRSKAAPTEFEEEVDELVEAEDLDIDESLGSAISDDPLAEDLEDFNGILDIPDSADSELESFDDVTEDEPESAEDDEQELDEFLDESDLAPESKFESELEPEPAVEPEDIDEIDFDLDELLNESSDEAGSDNAVDETVLDFDLDNLAGEGEEAQTEGDPDTISGVIEELDLENVEDDMDVMFDLAEANEDQEADTVTEEPTEPDMAALDFNIDDLTAGEAPLTDEEPAAGQESSADKATEAEVEGIDFDFEATDITAVEAQVDEAAEQSDNDSTVQEQDKDSDEQGIEFSLDDAIDDADIEDAAVEIDEDVVDLDDSDGVDFDLGDITAGAASDASLIDNETDEIEEVESLEFSDEENLVEDTESDMKLDDLDFLSADSDETSEVVEEDFDFLTDDDEAATKLDLAYAYQKMGDTDGAREILEEVIKEGNDAQAAEAKTLLETLD